MKDEKMLTVKISEQLHKEIKLRAVERNMTLREFVKELFENELKRNKRRGF